MWMTANANLTQFSANVETVLKKKKTPKYFYKLT